MPPSKTEEDCLRLIILQLEAEVAYLKGGEYSNFRMKSNNGNYPNAKGLNKACGVILFSPRLAVLNGDLSLNLG